MREEITLSRLSAANILMDKNDSIFYIIPKKYLSNSLLSLDKIEFIFNILKNNTILIKSRDSYLIKSNFSILLILENQKILNKYKNKSIFIDVRKGGNIVSLL